tara:strand:- start:983 stop:1204 length:222 start_codon:yes stop_codon:yes gene_type:complete
MANSYNISRNAIGIRLSANDEFMFRWDDGTQETSIRVSLHGAKALAETFRNFGYEEDEESIRLEKGDRHIFRI